MDDVDVGYYITQLLLGLLEYLLRMDKAVTKP